MISGIRRQTIHDPVVDELAQTWRQTRGRSSQPKAPLLEELGSGVGGRLRAHSASLDGDTFVRARQAYQKSVPDHYIELASLWTALMQDPRLARDGKFDWMLEHGDTRVPLLKRTFSLPHQFPGNTRRHVRPEGDGRDHAGCRNERVAAEDGKAKPTTRTAREVKRITRSQRVHQAAVYRERYARSQRVFRVRGGEREPRIQLPGLGRDSTAESVGA